MIRRFKNSLCLLVGVIPVFILKQGVSEPSSMAIRLREIGIQPEGRRTYELADGSEVALDVAVARIEFMGEVVGVTVIFDSDDAEPLLGVTALESVGIEVDPQNQRLKRLPAVRLKVIQCGNDVGIRKETIVRL
jgi:hypothetical protein